MKVQSSKFKVQSMRSRGFYVLLLTLHLSLLTASNAHAMHISEGLLPLKWAVLWYLLAVPFILFGLSRLKRAAAADLSFKPFAGLMAAAVFIISCMPIPVPLAGTCAHPAGTGVSAILVGPGISIVISSAALLLQALFLAHGGISTLGANILSMGVMGSFAGYLAFMLLRKAGTSLVIAGFFAGLCADWATYITASAELAAGIRGESPFLPLFGKITAAFIPTQLPLGILEGAMTAGMIVLLHRNRPDLLVKMGVLGSKESGVRSEASRVMSLILLFLLTPNFSLLSGASAAEKWQGVDKTVVEQYAKEHGREAREPLIDTDQGDLLLFLFLAAGAIGGFAAGYSWRMLMERKKEDNRKADNAFH